MIFYVIARYSAIFYGFKNIIVLKIDLSEISLKVNNCVADDALNMTRL